MAPKKGSSNITPISMSSLNGTTNKSFIADTNIPISIISETHHSNNNPSDQHPAILSSSNGSAFPGSTSTPSLNKTDNGYHNGGYSNSGSGGRSPASSGSGSGAGGGDGSGVVVETDEKSKPSQDMEMKRSINLLYCTAILVAVTGHSSIFIAPSQIMGVTGSLGWSLLLWLIGGVISMGVALCFAELGTMYPKAGGPYAYAMISFGPLMGFLMVWGYTILIAGPFWAFLAYTAALYITRTLFTSCMPDEVLTATKILAGWIIGE